MAKWGAHPTELAGYAPALTLALNSPKCLEEAFCELRPNGVLGSSRP